MTVIDLAKIIISIYISICKVKIIMLKILQNTQKKFKNKIRLNLVLTLTENKKIFMLK
jgi:hypothetical protein